MSDISDKKFWFLLSYMVQAPGAWVPHSIIVASDCMELTVPQLNNLKKAHQVPDASVLMSVSQLGWMTEKKINGKPEIDPPTEPTEGFRRGMHAATQVRDTEAQQPINPYVGGSNAELAAAEEWRRGFALVRELQFDNRTPIIRTSEAQMPLPTLGERAEPVGGKKPAGK